MMNAPKDLTLDIHQAAVDASLQNIFPQYHNRLRALQYAVPHTVTLRHVTAGMNVLDWGCGNGHFSWFLLRHGLRVAGYSFGNVPQILTENPDFRHVRGTQQSPVALPFADNEFDAVFSIGVLEHVHDCGGSQARSMHEIARVLKPGGKFLCFHLPNALSWVEHLSRVLKKTISPKIHAHTKLFDEQDIQNLCNKADLKILEHGRYNFIPRNNIAKIFPALTNRGNVVDMMDAADRLINQTVPYFSQQRFFIAMK